MQRVAGARRRVPCYVVGETEVWGATAMVLAELAALWPVAGGEDRWGRQP